jgi:DNA-binding transcriptional regulator GbsR (MarR family)
VTSVGENSVMGKIYGMLILEDNFWVLDELDQIFSKNKLKFSVLLILVATVTNVRAILTVRHHL